MKILILENEPSSKRGGQEWCLLHTCRNLAERGHEIYLVYQIEGDLLSQYREFCRGLIQGKGFRVHHDRLTRSTVQLLRSILSLLKLTPDLIYANHYNDIFFTGILARLKQVPLVCHLHVFPPQKFGLQCGTQLQSVTRFIAVSEATKRAYVQAGFAPETVEVVYNGIDLQRFSIQPDHSQIRQSLGIPGDAFVVLYAGRIDPPKNIEMLLEAFADLGLTAEHGRLLIAGSPVNHATFTEGQNYLRSLQTRAQQLQIPVHWLGSCANLPEIYRAADVTVLPSLLPDTFGLVLAESMACGTPALGLRYGGIPEVLGDEFSRFQIAVGDRVGLTAMLRSLQNWQQHDPTLGQRCRAYVEQRFTLERSTWETEQVFQHALSLGAQRLGPSTRVVQAWAGAGAEFCERS